MKHFYILICAMAIATAAQSQVVLTQESHGFVGDEANPMQITAYVEPGIAGNGVVWDFSQLDVSDSFTGSLSDFYMSKCCNLFGKGNVVLEEFENYFVFESSKSALKQYGYLSSNGNTRLEYEKPFIKMRYPFTFGNIYNGNFLANYILNDKKIGEVSGTYSVEGDGCGKLILPSGKILEPVLRVKETKLYTQTINNSEVKIDEQVYRWYVQNHRFPVLVLIKGTYFPANGKVHVQTKAAFNTNVVNVALGADAIPGIIDVDVYPNPYRGWANISYALDKRTEVNISVYDLSGKLVHVIVNEVKDAGFKTQKFSAVSLGYPAGAYILKLRLNNKEVTRKLVEVK